MRRRNRWHLELHFEVSELFPRRCDVYQTRRQTVEAISFNLQCDAIDVYEWRYAEDVYRRVSYSMLYIISSHSIFIQPLVSFNCAKH